MSDDRNDTAGRSRETRSRDIHGRGPELRDLETAAVFDGMDWGGEGWRSKAAASPPPSLRQPASSYFADFPWGD